MQKPLKSVLKKILQPKKAAAANINMERKGVGPNSLGSPLKLKDACYYKVKAQYDVFPSAYASGAIAKCRKNKGKKK